MAERFDVGVIIPLEEEYLAIREILPVLRSWPQRHETFYEIDVSPARPRVVAVVLGAMSQEASAVAAERLTEEFRTGLVVVLGIAGSLSDKARLGDVVVPNVIDMYRAAAKAVPDESEGSHGFHLQLAGEPYRTDHMIERSVADLRLRPERAADLAAWRGRAVRRRQQLGLSSVEAMRWCRSEPEIVDGHIASGTDVGAAASFAVWLKRRDRSYVALEMEAGGASVSAHRRVQSVPLLVLRGVSDLADERKAGFEQQDHHWPEGAWRRYAVQNAADLLVVLLADDRLWVGAHWGRSRVHANESPKAPDGTGASTLVPRSRPDTVAFSEYIDQIAATLRRMRATVRSEATMRAAVATLESDASNEDRTKTQNPLGLPWLETDGRVITTSTVSGKPRTISSSDAVEIVRKGDTVQFDPGDARGPRWFGDALFQAEMFGEAAKMFSLALQVDPYDAGTLYRRGTSLARLKRYAEALTDLDRSLALRPDDPDALNNRGSVHLHQNDYQAAVIDLTRCLELEKRPSAMTLFSRALALGLLERPKEALRDLRRTVRLEPTATHYATLAAILGLEHRHADAVRAYSKALNLDPRDAATQRRFDDALADLDAALAIEQDDQPLVVSRGSLLYKMGRREEGLTVLLHGLASVENPELQAFRGRALEHLKLDEEALAAYNAVLRAHPDDTSSRERVGGILIRLGRHKQALAAYSALIERQPDHQRALAGKGAALFHLRRYREAAEAYTQALALRPDDYISLANRGGMFVSMGHLEDGIVDFSHALEIAPSDTELLMARGAAYERAKTPVAALADYSRVIALDGAAIRARVRRAEILVRLGHDDEAVAEFLAALAVDPHQFVVEHNLGAALAKLGRLGEALQHFDAALRLEPNDPVALTNRGRTLFDLGRPAEAVTSYDQSLLVRPHDARTLRDRDDALAALEKS